MRKALAFFIVLLFMAQLFNGRALAADDGPTPPIANGTINKVTYIYWGKSEMFPTLGLVGPGTKLDVYEYDKTWVLVLYDTYISVGGTTQAHSFYGYVKRTDITCDPELEGDKSASADTGPGKRKGKKPKAAPTDSPADPPEEPEEPGTEEPEPTIPEDEQEELDWIIRTPGMCKVSIDAGDGVVCKVSFALMAQKFGGYAASSDPIYNNSIHNPYAATGFFSMISDTQDMLENWGVTEFLSGSGGFSIVGEAPGTKIYIDTKSDDFALVDFTLNMNATGTLNPKITDGNITGSVSSTVNMAMPLPVLLKKVGSGYKFILKGMRPGGGDLEFQAVLEKAFHDPNREAKEEDARRKRAEDLRKKMLDKMKEEMRKEQEAKDNAAKGETSSTDPLTVPGDNGEDITLAPLVPSDGDIELAPLVPPEDDTDLAPLVPSESEGVNDFPTRTP